MIGYFSGMSHDERESLIDEVEEMAFESEQDECKIVKAVCSKCHEQYEEEFEAAKVLIRNNMSLLCIKCSPAGGLPGLTAIVLIGDNPAFFRSDHGE